MKVAAMTIVWNEPHFLPIWINHYSQHVGIRNCLVIDHGSDDGSTANLRDVNLIRLPRTPHENEKRARLISEFASGLLAYYDAVIYSDVDELLVADPEHYENLADFCRKCGIDVVTAIGLDVSHDPNGEPDLDPGFPVSLQRSWVRFVSPMCKPLIVRRPVVWQPGFHSADAEIRFDRLFLFHLRWSDLKAGLTRLAKTRAMERAHPWVAPHQAISDEKFANNLIDGLTRSEPRSDVTLRPNETPLKEWLDRILAEQSGRAEEMYRIDLNLIEPSLWRLPPRFRGLF